MNSFSPSPSHGLFRVLVVSLLSFALLTAPMASAAAAVSSSALSVPAKSETKNQTKTPAADESIDQRLFVNAPAASVALPQPVPAPLASAAAVVPFLPAGAVTATMAAALTATANNNSGPDAGKADPGDTITYTVQLGNTTGTDATGLTFSDTIDSHTTLFGSVNSTPIAFDKSATTNEDTAVNITISGQDPDGSTLTFRDPSTHAVFGASTSTTHGTLGAFSAPDCTTTPGICTTTAQYTPAQDYNGSDSFTFEVFDGTAKSNEVGTVSITVNAVDDPPTFTPGGNQTVSEDSGAQSVANFVTNISPGPANESSQTVNFVVSNVTHSALFSTQPSIDSTGKLTYTPATNANGTSTITYHALDSGCGNQPNQTHQPCPNGGSDISADQTFIITVNAVNDAPVAQDKSFTAQANMKIVGVSPGLLTGVTDPDAINGTNDSLSFDAASNYKTNTATFAVNSVTVGGANPCTNATISNISAANGTFDFDPPPGFSGTCTLQYTVNDSGFPTPAKTSAAATITVTVNGPVIWFVNPTTASPATGDGRLSNPFSSLAQATTAMGITSNQRIFVYGNGTATASGTGVTLSATQWLIGQGVTATDFDTLMGITPPAGTIARPSVNGTRPTIQGRVQMNGNNTRVQGIDIKPPAGTQGLTATNGSAPGVGTALSGLQVGVSSTQSDVTVSAKGTSGANAMAVSLNNVGGTFSFISISADKDASNNAPAKGISLTSTTGSFTVLGSGTTAGSGGTIQNTTSNGAEFKTAASITLKNINLTNTAQTNGDNSPASNCGTTATSGANVNCTAAVYLSSANTVTLNNVNINGTHQNGINGLNVVDLQILNSTVQNAGNESGETGVYIQNLTGNNLALTNSTFSGNFTTQFAFTNFANSTGNIGAGSQANPFNVSGCTFTGRGNNVTPGGDGFQGTLHNSTTGYVSIGGGSNAASHFKSSQSFAAQLDVTDTANATFIVNGCDFGAISGSAIINSNNNGITSAVSNGATMNYTFTNNTIYGSGMGDLGAGGGAAIVLSTGPLSNGATFNGSITGNTIGSATISGSGCDGNCNGIYMLMNGGGTGTNTFTGTISNNSIHQVGASGIQYIGGDANKVTGSLHINGNTIDSPFFPSACSGTSACGQAINLSAETSVGSLSPNNSTLCADIGTTSANSISGAWNIFSIRVQALRTSVFKVGGWNGSPAGDPTSFISGKNGNVSVGKSTGSTNPGTFTGDGTSCSPLMFALGGVYATSGNSTSGHFDFGIFQTTNTLAPVAGITPCLAAVSGLSTYSTHVASVPDVADIARPNTVTASLTQQQLDSVVSAAIERWTATGLTEQQVTTLRSIKFEISNLSNSYLGEAEDNRILIDRNAGGLGWYIGFDEQSDSDFAHSVSSTRLYTDSTDAPAGHLDLLTAVMHEMGHQLKLDDTYSATDRDNLMYGYLTAGERRVPAQGQAKVAQLGELNSPHFLSLSPEISQSAEQFEIFASVVPLLPLPAGQTITIQGAGSGFTLPTGKTITITFKVTLNNPPNLSGPTNPKVSNQGTLQGSFTGSPILTDDPSTINTPNDATVTLVDLFNSTTAVSSSSATSNTSQSVTFTATIGTTGSPAPPNGTNRTGTVAFYDGSIAPANIISGCGTVSVASNQAQCTTTALSNGPHTINAAYSGDGNFDPSDTTGSSITQTVSKSDTTTTVGSSGTPSLLSQSVTYTATVASKTSVTGPPTGTVIFKDGGTTISGCGSVSLSSGQAQCTTTPATTGAHTITAFYNGDDTNNRFNASDNTASPFTQQVNQSDVTVAVSSSSNPSLVSQSVTFTATLNSNTAVAGPPTGTIQFRDGPSGTGTAIGSPVTLTTGGGCPPGKSCASVSTSTLSAGTHTITADYGGDSNFSATSGTLSGGQVVNKSDTATTLQSSQNPVAPSTNVTFTATVTSQTAVTGPPTGTVTFYDGTVAPGNEISGCNAATLDGSGVATCTTSYATPSTHSITAVYNGDDSSNRFNTSTSNTISQRIGTCTSSVVVTNTSDNNTGDPVVAGSLREALTSVCTGGTITFNIPTSDSNFSGGVYTIKLKGGELAVNDNMTITGLGASSLTVSGENASRVFNVASGKTVNISGMSITNGKAADGTAGDPAGNGSDGGAIYNSGTLTLSSVVVSNSKAGNGGNNNGSGVGGNGGGGGGIFNAVAATLMITNSTINGNQSGTGGTGSSAGFGGPGGGVYSKGDLTISGSTFNDNKALGAGSEGGGIDSEGGTLTIANSTISGNTTDGEGGGLLNCGNSTAFLTNVTITNNRADADDAPPTGSGGGIGQISSNSITLRNTIVAGNFKGTSSPTASDVDGTVDSSSSFNLIGVDTGLLGITNADANKNQVGTSGSPIDPLLDALNDNGGPTKTHAFTSGSSPAIDKGNGVLTTLSAGITDTASPKTITVTDGSSIPAGVGFRILIDSEQMIVTAKSGNQLTVTRAAAGTTAATHSTGANVSLPTDQRGFPRPFNADGAPPSAGDDSDIGAFEKQNSPAAPTNPPDLQSTVTNDTGVSQTDNITKNNNPAFDISVVTPGATVELLRDTSPTTDTSPVVASGTASGTTITLTDNSSLADGVYYYSARQRFGSDKSARTADLTVTIDTTPPAAPSITGQPNNPTSLTDATFNFNDADATATSFQCRLDGGSYATCTSPQTYNGLAPGSHTFDVKALDDAGNDSTATSFTWTIDTTAPTVTINQAVGQNDPTNSSTINFTVVFSKPVSDFATGDVTLSGTAGATTGTVTGSGTTYNVGVSGMTSDGTVIASVGAGAAHDAAGNPNAASTSTDNTVTYDSSTPAPSINSHPNNPTNQTDATFGFSSSEAGVSFQCKLDSGSFGACTSTKNYTGLGEGSHTFTVKAIDTAGNENQSSFTWVIDTTPPDTSITSNPSNPSNTASATFNFTSTEANSTFTCQLDANAPEACNTGTKSYSSLADGNHTFTVKATDPAGNTDASAASFTWTIDTTPPSVTSITRANSNPTNQQTVNFNVTFSEAVTGVDTGDFAVTTTGGVTGASVTTVTPVDGSHYTVTVNTGTGDGSLRLDFISNGTVKDTTVNLSTTANFTAGEVYTVSKSDPFVSSITRGNPTSSSTNAASVDFTVIFSKPVTGVNIGANSDFALVKTGGITGESITNLSGSGTTYTVTVNTGSGDGTLRLDVIDDDTIVDSGGRKLGGTGTTPGNGDGSFHTGEVYTIDKTAPTVSVAKAAGQQDPVTGPTASTVINFTVTFSEAVTNFGSANVSLSGSAGATVSNVTGSGTTYNVGVEGMTQSGSVTITIPANAAQDLAGNGNTSTNPTNTATVQFFKDNFSTFVVNTTADTDDGSCDPLGTGTGNKDCTLREAINAANADAGAETISFDSTVFAPAGGPYTITLLTALPDIASDMTISGTGANLLTVKRSTAGGTPQFRIFTINSGATVTISGMTITNGHTTDSSVSGAVPVSGAGISNSGNLTLTNSTVSGNQTGNGGGPTFQGGFGGGIYNSGTLSISNSTINANQTGTGTVSGGHGGGIYSSGILTVSNSTISGNQTGAGAGGDGGGIIIAAGTATITNSTITGNTTSSGRSGGGIRIASGTATLRGTIVGGNTASTGPDISGTVQSDGFNLIQSTSGATINQNGGAGPNITGQDAQLKPLADNGGPTQTHALQCTSPAIDKGNAFGQTTDQRGFTRPLDFSDSVYPNATGGDGSDIGAFETQTGGGCLPIAIAPSPQPTTNEDTQVTVTMKGTFSQNTPLSFNVTQQPLNGSLSNQSSPSCSFDAQTSTQTCTATIQYTPAANYNGADLFKFKVSAPVGGGTLDSNEADVNITINAVNDPPVAGGNQNLTTDEDTQLPVTLTGTDVDSPTLTFSVTNPSHGSLSTPNVTCPTPGNCTATLTYTPAANYNGPDSFTYKVNDGQLDSAPSTISINVHSIADTPNVTNATTAINKQTTSGLVITRSNVDGLEIGSFKITNIKNGTLFKSNGTTQITDGQFITAAEGGAGLKFTPDHNLSSPGTTFSFDVQGANNAAGDGLGPAATATIMVNCGAATVVTNTADSGAGSLRDVITNACPGNTITFNLSGGSNTITLTSGEIVIDKDLTITGPGANTLTIQRSSGAPDFRIFNINSGETVSISGLTISGGKATSGSPNDSGGGILNDRSTLSLSGVVISGNSAFFGGGVFNKGDGGTASLTITNSTISGNSATNIGGGVYNSGNSGTASLTIDGSTISGNSSTTAGGIYSSATSGTATLTMTNATVSGNTAINNGGGIFNNSGTATLTNLTVTNNRANSASLAGNGGGLSVTGGTVTLRNTIIAGNFNGANPSTTADNINGTVDPTSSFNLIGTGGSGGLTNGVNNNQVNVADAKLAPLGNYGGTTQTHVLLPASPAINAGSNTLATNAGLTTDQRGTGFPRVVNTTVDIGAVEANYAISSTAGNNQSATINAAFATQLKATIKESNAPLSGVPVTFTAPSSGASGTFQGSGATVTVNTDSNGVATAPVFTANGVAGSYNVVASLATGQPTSTFALTNNTAATSTALASSVNPSDFNQSVTFTATVTSTAGTPTGAVQFKDNGANLGGPVTLTNGVATFTTSTLAIGTHPITADYSGDGNFLPSSGTLAGGQVVKSQLSISDVSLAEGNAGTKSFNFTVTLSQASTVTAKVDFATSDGTAKAGSDYVATSGTLTFNPGETTKTVTVLVNGDTLNEPDETFFVTLSNPVNATITRAQATGTIQNDDGVPSLSINDVTKLEGNSGTTNFDFTVTLSASSGQTVTVNFATADGTATVADNDYQAQSGTLTFNPGETTKTITVLVNGDTKAEPDENFFVNLSNATNAAISDNQGMGTILSDDTPLVQFSAAAYNVKEDGLHATITVKRLGDLSKPATVDYATSDPSGLNDCSQVTGNASQRCDYAITVGTLRFAAGEDSKMIFIPIVNDVYIEGPEFFTISLSNPVGAELGAITSARVNIIDDDNGGAVNPITDDAFFIRQLYIDFLDREPEPSGLQGWLDILHNTNGQCKLPTDCDRIAVALGFVRSPEFQDRGYFIFRFYSAALGRNPGYFEFMTDMARVSGFLNSSELEANKSAFVDQFMNRQEFKNLYDSTLNDPAGYVDKLLKTVGIPNHPTRNTWVTGLQNGTLTRAQVLRQIVESTEVYTKFYNQALIVMQYFGFLRRDPDAAYQAWIDIFNHSDDYRIIVNGFINSPEYPLRFGP